MVLSAKEEFIELLCENSRCSGSDEITSKIFSILYIEPREISLDEIANRSGYSLSAVSTATKLLESYGLIKKSKKSKSRKIYFFMEKDMMPIIIRLIKKNYEKLLLPTKEKLPQIIEKYRREKSVDSKKELRIVEAYYKRISGAEQIVKKVIEDLEKLQRKVKI